MVRCVPAVLFVLVLLVPALAAEKTLPALPRGTWMREVGTHKLTFTFKPGTMRLTLTDDSGNTIQAEAATGVTPTGVLFGTITKVEKKGTDGGPAEGDLFRFQFVVEKAGLTISDLRGTNVNDEGRKLVEGLYKEVKK